MTFTSAFLTPFLLVESDSIFLYSSLHNDIVRNKPLVKRDFLLEDTHSAAWSPLALGMVAHRKEAGVHALQCQEPGIVPGQAGFSGFCLLPVRPWHQTRQCWGSLHKDVCCVPPHTSAEPKPLQTSGPQPSITRLGHTGQG